MYENSIKLAHGLRITKLHVTISPPKECSFEEMPDNDVENRVLKFIIG
jgi:hypothetical protein